MTHLGDREDSSVAGSENEARRTGLSTGNSSCRGGIDEAVVVQGKQE